MIVAVLALLPLLWLTFAGLGVNPVERLTHFTGAWALRFLLLTLAVTPLRRALARPALIRFRRPLGLAAFFYAALHFSVWFLFDHSLDFNAMAADIARRPYITAGAVALAVMAPLALTSTRAWIARLGGRNWSRLHRLVWLAAAAAIVHFLWLVKSDLRAPLVYAACAAALALARRLA